MNTFAFNLRIAILLFISITAVIALCIIGPIAQDPAYHHFADSRRVLGIDNFCNVLSNIPFLVVGVFGLLRASRLVHEEGREAYIVMCSGVLLVGFGSAWYHFASTNGSLLWDRLPMTVAFMALFSLLLGERVMHRYRRPTLLLLVAAGVGSALYWAWTESSGRGDLRPYVLVQFLPIVLMPLILLMFRQRYLSSRLLLAAFALYIAAKALEHFDASIYSTLGFVSGHSLKHVVAAAAVLCIVLAVPVTRRDRVAVW